MNLFMKLEYFRSSLCNQGIFPIRMSFILASFMNRFIWSMVFEMEVTTNVCGRKATEDVLPEKGSRPKTEGHPLAKNGTSNQRTLRMTFFALISTTYVPTRHQSSFSRSYGQASNDRYLVTSIRGGVSGVITQTSDMQTPVFI